MDTEGYLFITGRSKDVINRGGEIISPVEVEDAVVSHPRIDAAMAFSVTHNVLQVIRHNRFLNSSCLHLLLFVVHLSSTPKENTLRVDASCGYHHTPVLHNSCSRVGRDCRSCGLQETFLALSRQVERLVTCVSLAQW